MTNPVRLMAFLIAACLALSGCGIVKVTRPGEYDSPLEAKLAALRTDGGSAPLTDLTDFAWDEVYLFNSYTGRDVIEKAVGDPVIDGRSVPDHTSLLVFKNGGEVVEAISVGGDYVRGDEPSWGRDVVVTPWSSGFLKLTNP